MRSLNQYILEYLPISKIDKNTYNSSYFLELLEKSLDLYDASEISKHIDTCNFDKVKSMNDYDSDDIYCAAPKKSSNLNLGLVFFNIEHREYVIYPRQKNIGLYNFSSRSWLYDVLKNKQYTVYIIPNEIKTDVEKILNKHL